MNKKIIYALFVVSISPVIVSWMCYLGYKQFHFKPSAHHGTLLNPPVKIHSLLKQWQIAVAFRHCKDIQNNKMIFNLLQLHKLLGEDQSRVALTLLLMRDCDIKYARSFHKLIIEQPSAIVLDNIYLIDPLGNLFMYYSYATEFIELS